MIFPAFRSGRPITGALFALSLSLLLSTPSGAFAQTERGGEEIVSADLQEVPSHPGESLRVWLVTVGQGDAVWERFGHNAIRVVDSARGTDVSYNWGLFDFNQVDFIPRFLRGEMLYSMAAFPTGAMIESYTRSGREVVLQELELTPEERQTLQDRAEWNALPENREYRYDYFLDNCSTRVRDVLDLALGGALAAEFRDRITDRSFRDHIRRLTAADPPLFTGMDVLLGSPGDRPISVWEEMFIPMTLRDAVRGIQVLDPRGGARPLVRSEERIEAAGRIPEPVDPPRWEYWFLGVGLLLGGFLHWMGKASVRISYDVQLSSRGGRLPAFPRFLLAVVGGAWSLVAGLVGILLVAVLFTDHHFMFWNEAVLLASPLSLGVALLLPVALIRGRGIVLLSLLSWGAVALAVLGVVVSLLPLTDQDTTNFLLLALPAHLGLALGIQQLPAAE